MLNIFPYVITKYNALEVNSICLDRKYKQWGGEINSTYADYKGCFNCHLFSQTKFICDHHC